LTAIEVDHLVKRFGGFPAVEDVSFDAPADQVAAVLGPNGAGTTIVVLEGFLAPSAGAVRVLGVDPRRSCGDHPGPVSARPPTAVTTPTPGPCRYQSGVRQGSNGLPQPRQEPAPPEPGATADAVVATAVMRVRTLGISAPAHGYVLSGPSHGW
jgi:ABC-type cobalamin/Fe3+-siderophores transport system ATPase subunit